MGMTLESARPRSERRGVCVLVVDLAGLMGVLERADPDAVTA